MIYDVRYGFTYTPIMDDRVRPDHRDLSAKYQQVVNEWMAAHPPFTMKLDRCFVIRYRPLWCRIINAVLPWLVWAVAFTIIVQLAGLYR